MWDQPHRIKNKDEVVMFCEDFKTILVRNEPMDAFNLRNDTEYLFLKSTPAKLSVIKMAE